MEDLFGVDEAIRETVYQIVKELEGERRKEVSEEK